MAKRARKAGIGGVEKKKENRQFLKHWTTEDEEGLPEARAVMEPLKNSNPSLSAQKNVSGENRKMAKMRGLQQREPCETASAE